MSTSRVEQSSSFSGKKVAPPGGEASDSAKSLEAFPLGSISPTGSVLPLIPKIKTHLYASTLPVCVMSIAQTRVDIAADEVDDAETRTRLFRHDGQPLCTDAEYCAARVRLHTVRLEQHRAECVLLDLMAMVDNIDIVWLGSDE